jgi:GTP-binding protein
MGAEPETAAGAWPVSGHGPVTTELAPAGAGGLPVVAIVGRPNVGKSALFNRLVRQRRAIVDDAPGVTRDRIVAAAAHSGRAFLCVDTGGFSPAAERDAAALVALVRAQTLAAIDEADCVVCVLDGQAGLAPEDHDIVDLLRRSGKPVLFAVNKLDTPARDSLLHDFRRTGADPVLAVSAAHGRGLEALLDAIVATLPADAPAAVEALAGTRLALIGRPNVGKSSLLNRLLGAERAIVAPEAGTTRDAIDTPITVDGCPYVLIDTAGIRRRTHAKEVLERHGAVRALGTLARTDLVLLVLEASEGMSAQDARLVSRAWEAGRGVILLANKWDLVPRPARDRAAFRQALAEAHPAFADLPLVCVSARTGEGLADVFPVVRGVERAYQVSLATPALNRALRAAVAEHPPPVGSRGRAVRLLYLTQTGTRPPMVTIFTSAPAAITPAYARYLTGRLVQTFALSGVPLRVRFAHSSSTVAPHRRPPRTPRGRRPSVRKGGPRRR